MYNYFGGLGALPLAKHMKSRAINAENPTGEKGKGGSPDGSLGTAAGRMGRAAGAANPTSGRKVT